MINVIFESEVDLYFARSRVLERLKPPREGHCPRRSCRRSARTRPGSGTSSGTPSRAKGLASASSGHFRTGSSATSSTRCRAWRGREHRRHGAPGIRSNVDPNRLRAYKIRSRPWSTPSCGATATSVAMSSRGAGPGPWCVASADREHARSGRGRRRRRERRAHLRAPGRDVKLGDAFRAAALVKGRRKRWAASSSRATASAPLT